MDLRLTDEQEHLVEAFAGLYARESTPERVRAAEPGGFDKALWERLTEMGVVPMAVPEDAGGWGASLLDLALIAEQQGRALGSAPVVEAQVAARLLARLGEPVGDRLTTLALHPVTGDVATMVPAAAAADDAIVLAGDRLLLIRLGGRVTPVDNLGSLPLADVLVAGAATELAAGAAAGAAYERAVDEWLCLTAAALTGIGARALDLGVEYVKERKAWGVPIGTFQAIAHRLADAATEMDGARLLAYEAAWAADARPERFAELAAAAFPFAYEAARDTTYWSLHFHGGYGFMMEYDVQLYWRRARALGLLFGTGYGRLGDRRYG